VRAAHFAQHALDLRNGVGAHGLGHVGAGFHEQLAARDGIIQAGDAGGVGARGDEQAGAILVITLDKGANPRVWERGIGPSGAVGLISVGPQASDNEEEIRDYWRRRRARDPDLWVIELDIAQAERFAAETISEG